MKTLDFGSRLVQRPRKTLLAVNMSNLRRIWSKHDGGPSHSKTFDDLERGQDSMNSPASEKCQPSIRTSYADSEFSQNDFPVSPDRYEEALYIIERKNPSTPVSPERYEEALSIIEGNSPQTPMYPGYYRQTFENLEGNSPRTPICSKGPKIFDVFDDREAPKEKEDRIELDPGDSQTSSSLSAGQLESGRKGRLGFRNDSSFSSSKMRSPTPPLLFGSRAITSRPALGVGASRLEQVMKASEIGANSRLKKAVRDIGTYQTGLMEGDWETISDLKTNATQLTDDGSGSSLANNSDSGNLSLGYVPYHHPIPLPIGHRNPFTSSPPMIAAFNKPAEMIGDHDGRSSNSVMTDSFNQMVEMHGSSNESSGSADVVKGREATREQREQAMTPKQSTSSSSPWVSTLSEESPASKSPEPIRTGSFAKVAVIGPKGNLTGTPEGTGSREVGSSLAGASSPPTLSDSPNQASHANNALISVKPSLKRQLFPFSPSATPEAQSGFSFELQDLESRTPAKTRRRRSSSESNCKVITSPSTMKASALASPEFRGHKKRNTMTALLSPGKSSVYENEDFQDNQYQSTLRERKGHQAHNDFDQISPYFEHQERVTRGQTSQATQTSTSTESRPYVHRGVVHTDVPRPLFVHPVYGLERPWDTPIQHRGRPQARSDRYQRPIARVESPHLHRIPRPPTAAMVERQRAISNFWLPIFCILPPVALIFAHGFADEIIRMQTDGEIDNFTDSTKTTALYWGYGVTPLMIVMIVLAAILVGSK